MAHTMRGTSPVDAVIAVTYICNSRCTMCDFWKETRQPTLTVDDYRKLPSTLRDINVSGGEPFLHPKLVDIVRVLHETCPRARITISTNGFLTDRIVDRVRAILAFLPDFRVRISLDGVGEMHERIRRIPQGYEKCLRTLRELRAIGVRDLGFAYTMTGENVDHLLEVYRLAERERVHFTCAYMHTSDAYFGNKENTEHATHERIASAFDVLIATELRRWHPKRWVRAYFAYGLRVLATEGRQLLPSRPGVDYFFLDPFGNVLPSVMHPNVLGNLSGQSFAAVWSSADADRARHAAARSPQPYWLICTARTAIRRHPFRVIAWILRRKLGTLGGVLRFRTDRTRLEHPVATHA